MTTEARLDLSRRGNLLNAAADYKLHDPKNVAKGDGWASYDDLTLLEKLGEEAAEISSLLHVYHLDESGMGNEEFRFELRKELGDVINVLRFIADKYGAL